ncbi:hypothetical protein EVA_21059, partial [gut metagenome]
SFYKEGGFIARFYRVIAYIIIEKIRPILIKK